MDENCELTSPYFSLNKPKPLGKLYLPLIERSKNQISDRIHLFNNNQEFTKIKLMSYPKNPLFPPSTNVFARSTDTLSIIITILIILLPLE